MERIKKAIEKARASAAAGATAVGINAETRSARCEVTGEMPSRIKVARIDTANLERHRIIAGNKEDPRTASFDLLRTQVLREMRDNGYHSLGVTSPTPGCGKTTVAINLALGIAQLSAPTVLLGDLDFRRPKIGEYLGIHLDNDLPYCIETEAPLAEVLVNIEFPRLLLLPNTKAHHNAAEVLTSPRMKSIIQTLTTEDEGRVCIFDLPPMLTTDDTIAFLPQVDCLLVIIADGSTKKPELAETLRLMTDAPLLGVVLNKSDVSLSPY